jgi:hypothetical protein
VRRRTIATLLAAGLPITGACGGDDETSAGDGGEAPADAGGGEGGGGDLCEAYESMDAASDPQAMAEQFASIDPPDEIADAWGVIMDAGPSVGSPEMAEAYQQVSEYMEECFGGTVSMP